VVPYSKGTATKSRNGLKFTEVALAVPLEVDLKVTHEGGAEPEVSTVKGVPPEAAELTEIGLLVPGV